MYASGDIQSSMIELRDHLALLGYISVKVPIYDDNGLDEGLPKKTDNGRYSAITVDGETVVEFYSMESAGSPQKEGDSYWVKSQITSSGKIARVSVFQQDDENNGTPSDESNGTVLTTSYQETTHSAILGTSYAFYRIYLSADYLKKLGSGSSKVLVHLGIDENNGNADRDVEADKSFTFNYPTAPDLNYAYSRTQPGKYDVTFTATINDRYKLSPVDSEYTTVTDAVDRVTKYVSRSNNEQKVTLYYEKKLSAYQYLPTESSVTIPALQYPENLTIEQVDGGRIAIKWTISTPSGTYVSGDRFEVQRSATSNFTEVKDIGSIDYFNGKTITIYDDASEENLNGTYYYRIRRTTPQSAWGWNDYASGSVEVAMKHVYVGSATGYMSDKPGSADVFMEWTYDDGNVMTNGSKLILTRTNTTQNNVQTQTVLPDTCLQTRRYVDQIPTPCDVYTYTIAMQPGAGAYAVQSPAVNVEGDDDFYSSLRGNVVMLSASKGYYSDRIELQWQTDGLPINSFSLKARKYGTDTEFRQIASVASSAGNKLYTYDYDKAEAGVIYEFKIAALTECADTTVMLEYKKSVLGFRTPTGEIYGRVTFDDGQAVPDVEVRAETADDAGIGGKAYRFDGSANLKIATPGLLKTATDSVSLEAWIKPDGDGTIVAKPEMYALRYEADKVYFDFGSQTLKSTETISNNAGGFDFVHVAAVAGDSLKLFFNDKCVGAVPRTASVTGNDELVTIGEGFKGIVDDVRLWNTARNDEQIAKNYGRYLVGNETGLAAYYTFDYSVDAEFFDISYSGTTYNKHHGVSNKAVITDEVPEPTQLSYKYYTDDNGSYFLRGLPYVGNGTTYKIIPTLGIHQFRPENELRLLNTNSQNHTVNFTDRSSFAVSGKVTYAGGNLPVEGVSFVIDGTPAMDGKGNLLKTDAAGMFEISVPVGQHEVRAQKQGHTFANGGKITNIDGSDRNYQDMVSGLELTDSTRVRYVGRVAGGTVQQGLPIGHPESRNNLADSVKVVLTYQNDAYTMVEKPHRETYNLYKSVYSQGEPTNDVDFENNVITIYPNAATGEFYADIIPEKYKVDVIVPGHDENPLPGSGEELSFVAALSKNSELITYTDSLSTEGVHKAVTDSISYNKKSLFIKRYSPSIVVRQKVNSQLHDYFGSDSVKVKTLDKSLSFTACTYDKTAKKYTFGMPVFEQNTTATLRISACELFRYKDCNGLDKEGVDADQVPSSAGELTFTGTDLAVECDTTIVTNSNGEADWSFTVNEPDMTSALRKVAIQYIYVEKANDEARKVTIDWDGKFDAIVLGCRSLGTDLITKGPDKVLFVLRDPPGSNSYSYLEKGVTVTHESTYDWALDFSLDVGYMIKAGAKQIYYVGAVGEGAVEGFDFEDVNYGGISGTLHYDNLEKTTTTATVTSRISTSSDPLYVGADGDVYAGFSTNVSLGKVENVRIISKRIYNLAPEEYEVYNDIKCSNDTLMLVKSQDIGFGQKYDTFFAYTQSHIEKTLIPELVETRNSLLLQNTESDAYYQQLANTNKSNIYVSKLKPDDKNFGKSNNDAAFGSSTDVDMYDGPSYKVYTAETVSKADTIYNINESIQKWQNKIKENEEQKVKAESKRNISYQGGADYSYAQSYSFTREDENDINFSIGANTALELGFNVSGRGMLVGVKNTNKTTHGWTWGGGETGTMAQGFVLSESGSDYLSVDVCTEPGYSKKGQFYKYDELEDLSTSDKTFPTLIFLKKGGATKCPYEPADTTKYYQPGTVLDESTIRIEVPELSVENNFIDNVPSGEAAKFTLYLRNNSEAQKDLYYDFSIDDSTNPNGAQFSIDGAPLGSGLTFFVPAGETVTKILEVRKGTVMNYDNMVFWLSSQCQCNLADSQDDIYDAISLSVHFTPSATAVNIKKPTDTWTYNTKLPTAMRNDVEQHYMDVTLNEFDINYENFHRVMLQYKPASASDDEWVTLMSYYADEDACNQAVANGQNAAMISSDDHGMIFYQWFMDDLPDQRYDLRAVGTSMISNEEYYNYSEVHSGVKDMYNPRLFGSAQPANGILTVDDEIRLNFNESIADGLLTDNNFEVTGVRNGATTDHSVSVTLDGENDAIRESLVRNWRNKDLTIELWALADGEREGVLFSHGTANDLFEILMTGDHRLAVRVGQNSVTTLDPVAYAEGEWAHIAVAYNHEGRVSAYYNYKQIINDAQVGVYSGEGKYAFGESVGEGYRFAGKMHNARIWDKIVPLQQLQTNSLTLLSGAESNLLAYYPMNEGRGDVVVDKARGVNMQIVGGEWTVPEGRAISLDGSSRYVKVPTGAAVVDATMDYTLEFWFKAAEGQTNATLAASGAGDGTDTYGSKNLFSLGFENGILTFRNNGYAAVCTGNYLDNDWHHVAVAVNRNSSRAQIYVDGALNAYFDALNLGGLESDYITLGAKPHLADTGETSYTDFFSGEIDEFRLWKLYRGETLTANGMSSKLDGSEKGLIAYYPFETYKDWQGTPQLVFSADCQVAGLDEPATAIVTDPSVETSMSAPIKAKEPVTDLLYDFVVNDDALIINLNEPYDRIEKQIVTFTVEGVRDLNGNEIISPITWSAYIDRNQLKWGETSLDFVKPYGEELTFTVKAVNNGGSVQYFTMENAPSWLSVSPSSGAIDPASEIDVRFTVGAGLNVGTYDEVVYMRNDNNVAEALGLNIKVEGEKPDWSVDPHAYQYNMSIFGKIVVDGAYSNDEDDMLAAFYKDECVGVCNNKHFDANDTYYALLTVYGNDVETGELEFRLRDASTGTTYRAEPSVGIAFKNNAAIGSPDNPVLFTASQLRVQTIPLESGWNWVSTNVDTEGRSVADVFRAGDWTENDQIKSEDGGFLSYDGGWDGTLYDMNPVGMYLVKCENAGDVEISGSPIDIEATPLKIHGNGTGTEPLWTYIAYLPDVALPVREALAGYDACDGDIIKSQTQMAMYSSTLGWVGTLEYMMPGKGYMLLRNSVDATMLNYPTDEYSSNSALSSQERMPSYARRYSGNATAVVSLEGIEIEPGDCLAAYVGGECRGETVVSELPGAGKLFLITLSGEGGEEVNLTLKRQGKTCAVARSAITYTPNANRGTLTNPLIVGMGDMGDLNLYPTPFTTTLNISSIVAAGAVANVYVTNMYGVRVASWLDCAEGGVVDITWNVPGETPDGVYVVTLVADGHSQSVKVIKK